jgi:hypothetical protein
MAVKLRVSLEDGGVTMEAASGSAGYSRNGARARCHWSEWGDAACNALGGGLGYGYGYGAFWSKGMLPAYLRVDGATRWWLLLWTDGEAWRSLSQWQAEAAAWRSGLRQSSARLARRQHGQVRVRLDRWWGRSARDDADERRGEEVA